MDRNFNGFDGREGKIGQARKSLWIETPRKALASGLKVGQARKSLWIETTFKPDARALRGRSGS